MRWITCLLLFCSTVSFLILLLVKLSNIGNSNEQRHPKPIEVISIENKEINFPFRKSFKYSIPMQNFDNEFEYQINNDPKVMMSPERKEIFHEAVEIAANKFNFKNEDFTHGSYRLLNDGIEYLLFFKNNQHRISLFQPFSNEYHLMNFGVPAIEKVNIILPLKGRLSQLSIFLDNLAKKILPNDKDVSLTIVYYSDESMKKAEKVAIEKLSNFPDFDLKFIPIEDKKFSRGKAINIGVKTGTESITDLLFACDVDVLILPEFLMNCRANAVYAHQVYFPVVFSLFNPYLVYSINNKPVPDTLDQTNVNKDNGKWRTSGFGMFCMHKREFDTVGGVPEYHSWGGEDGFFYEKFANVPSLKVIRSVDPSIFHMYHSKNCSNVSASFYKYCLETKASNEGTSMQLGYILFTQNEEIQIKNIFGGRFYHFFNFPILEILIILSGIIILYQWWLLWKITRRITFLKI